MRRIAMTVAALLVLCSIGFAQAEQLKVVSVADGDTFTGVDGRHRKVKVRLHGIDAPEKAQPFGKTARRSLGEMIQGKVVDVTPLDRDDYGRIVADVRVGGLSVNHTQVERGHAWRSPRHDTRGEFIRVELAARQAGRGLWADRSPVPPWVWRKREAQRKHAGQAPVGPRFPAHRPGKQPAQAGR